MSRPPCAPAPLQQPLMARSPPTAWGALTLGTKSNLDLEPGETKLGMLS